MGDSKNRRNTSKRGSKFENSKDLDTTKENASVNKSEKEKETKKFNFSKGNAA